MNVGKERVRDVLDMLVSLLYYKGIFYDFIEEARKNKDAQRDVIDSKYSRCVFAMQSPDSAETFYRMFYDESSVEMKEKTLQQRDFLLADLQKLSIKRLDEVIEQPIPDSDKKALKIIVNGKIKLTITYSIYNSNVVIECLNV